MVISGIGVPLGVESAVSGPEITDSDPHEPITFEPAMPVPSVNCQPISGEHAGCVCASICGLICWPDV